MNTRTRRLAPMLVVPTLLLALSGCSGNDGDGEGGESAAPEATPSATPSAATTSDPTSVSPKLPTPPRTGRTTGAVADVDWDPSTCGTETGEQSVQGTVTNPGRAATDYLITISWTNATSDVRGIGYATVEAARPRAEMRWKVTADVPDGAVQCVINVVRGDVRA